MNERRSYMGIWGVDPYVPREGTPFDAAANAAGKVQGLFGQYYKNQGSQLENQLKQGQVTEMNQTLGNKINALNSQYTTDARMYPLLQQAKLNQENATVKEIMSRTGVNYAQAKVLAAHLPLLQAQTNEVNAKLNPMYQFNALNQAYQKADAGSPQKIILGRMLQNMASGAGLGGGTNSKSPNGQSGSLPATQSGMVQNPIGSKYGTKQAYDPATGNTYEAPTTPSGTRNEQRQEGTKEIGVAGPVIQQGLSPYFGPLGSVKLGIDALSANLAPNSKYGQKAAEDLYNYSLAKRLTPEAANIIARMSGVTNLGVEGTKHQENASFGNNPLIPGNIQQQALGAYFPLQENLANSAVDVERTGYPHQSQNPPAWAGQGQDQIGYFGPNGYVSPEELQAQQQSQQQYQQPTAADYQAMADDAIKKGANPADVKKILSQLMGKK